MKTNCVVAEAFFTSAVLPLKNYHKHYSFCQNTVVAQDIVTENQPSLSSKQEIYRRTVFEEVSILVYFGFKSSGAESESKS